ncbi:MAG: glycoside hydrolase family 16 protein [Candidatus Azobacteroides sp.]|nr:glycoside hydrolase family 16 protein [Candidatus Azobacteroides sp.]
MGRIRLLLFLFSLVASSYAENEYKLVWSDEFDYNGKVDPEKWSYEKFPPGTVNNELQEYTDDLRNVEVRNGLLYITALKDGEKITSGRIVTKDKASWLYGKIEARILLPKGRGIWPAFWMMPQESRYGGWPKSGEIDILEFVGYQPDTVHATVHTKKYNHMINTQKGTCTASPGVSDDFHVYTCEWTPDKIEMYVDDNKYFSFENDHANDSGSWPFNAPFYVIFNVAVGGMWGGVMGVDENSFPQQMVVDYVRVYQK